MTDSNRVDRVKHGADIDALTRWVVDATARWREPLSNYEACDLATTMHNAGMVRLPVGAAGQIAAGIHEALCDCLGNPTGITLCGDNLDKIIESVRSLINAWRAALTENQTIDGENQPASDKP